MIPCFSLEEREKGPSTFGFVMKSFVNLYRNSLMVLNTIKNFPIAQLLKGFTFRSFDMQFLMLQYAWCSNLLDALMFDRLYAWLWCLYPSICNHRYLQTFDIAISDILICLHKASIVQTSEDHNFWSKSPFLDFHVSLEWLFITISNGEGLI